MANPLRTVMLERRAVLGYTQIDAAKKTGCSPGTWCRWESPTRLPTPKVWLKIAKTLGITLEQLQNAAGESLVAMSGGRPKQPELPGEAKKREEVKPEQYEYLSQDAAILDRIISNIDLHKLTQGGWHYYMAAWRSNFRELLQAMDLVTRMATSQAALFQKLHSILLGNESGRVLPLPKNQKYTPPSAKRGQNQGGGKGKKKH